MTNEKELERKIKRSKEKLKSLEERKEYLSEHGYWEIGYFKGRIEILEDWLDEIREAKYE